MRPIRASEISTFLFCKRAWYYQQRDTPSTNTQEIGLGTELHQKHGKAVFVSGFLRTLAYGLLLVALALMTVYVTNLVL